MNVRRIIDVAWIGSAFAAVVCLAIGWGQSGDPDSNRLAFQSEHDLGLLAPMRESYLTVPVTNPSRGPVTILGAEGHCSAGLCVGIADAPVEIPARGKANVRVHLGTGSMPGTYTETLKIYSSAPGQLELVLHFTGRIPEPTPT